MAASNNIILKVDSLKKEYNEHVILNDISFEVKKGEMVGIIGPNGAGKSTLANIILGFDTDYKGMVTLADDARVSFVPQYTKLDIYALPLSVEEFLRSAANGYYGTAKFSDHAHLVKMLRHVGLGENELRQNLHALSGGQLQRVLIARALVTDPNFLVLDEPLSSVDYASRESIYQLLRHLNIEHSITMIMISHDVESVTDIADTVLCLNQTLFFGCHPTDFVEHKGKGGAGCEHGHHHNI